MDLHRYRIQAADGVAKRTMISRLSEVRVFLRWARSVDAVPERLPELIEIPEAESARTRTLDPEAARVALDHLSRFQYATRDHAAFVLCWDTAARAGALRGLDVSDVDTDEKCVSFYHRPETGTPLKNGENGERIVAIGAETAQVLSDYIKHNRKDVTENGREPLFTTYNGRIRESPFRRIAYRWTRPCVYGDGCPHDRDPDDCEAMSDDDLMSRCPSTVSPHNVRRGRLTELCRDDVPKTVISDRCDVTPEVLDKHYNQMTDREKMEQRREYLN